MMYDKRIDFAGQSADTITLTFPTGRQTCGNTIDLGNILNNSGAYAGADYGIGAFAGPMFVVVQCSTGIANGTSGTLTFELVTDAQDPVLTNGTATIHATSTTWTVNTTPIPVGTLLFVAALPPILSASTPYERYLGLISNAATAALTAGAVRAFLTNDISRFRAYPDAIN